MVVFHVKPRIKEDDVEKTELPADLPKRLRTRIDEGNYRLRDIAKECGVSYATLSRICNRNIDSIYTDNLRAVEAWLDGGLVGSDH